MFFEKPSLRTRLTFEAGMDSLGGSAFFVDQTGSRLNARESLYDIAHNLERWIDIIVLRTFSHATVEEMATYASVPVINALSELEHPCQALADFFTLQEQFGDLQKLHFAYVGDGNNRRIRFFWPVLPWARRFRLPRPSVMDSIPSSSPWPKPSQNRPRPSSHPDRPAQSRCRSGRRLHRRLG